MDWRREGGLLSAEYQDGPRSGGREKEGESVWVCVRLRQVKEEQCLYANYESYETTEEEFIWWIMIINRKV